MSFWEFDWTKVLESIRNVVIYQVKDEHAIRIKIETDGSYDPGVVYFCNVFKDFIMSYNQKEEE